MVEKMYRDTVVVSQNIFADFIAGIENLFGWNLKPFEKMAEKAYSQLKERLDGKGCKLEWWRYEMTQLTNGALAVTLYGEKK